MAAEGRGRLHGRVALIAGGGGEIGGAISRRFAAEGAEIAVADLDPQKAEAVARAIADGGGRALALAVDVAKASYAPMGPLTGKFGIGLESTGSFDRTVRIWDVVTGRTASTLKGFNVWVLALAFNDGWGASRELPQKRTVHPTTLLPH